eukprot:comp23607_c0_seq1/m.40133 comp23607_c0_seq1/g.40133  ORF comp23607_c0_seq1/g.40133 comp23607_c0_seq1/m.40133 type:complete len:604 (-) comp23607_c0_seq1:412-2223(-)
MALVGGWKILGSAATFKATTAGRKYMHVWKSVAFAQGPVDSVLRDRLTRAGVQHVVGPTQIAAHSCPFCLQQAEGPPPEAPKPPVKKGRLLKDTAARETPKHTAPEWTFTPHFFVNAKYGDYDCKACGAIGQYGGLQEVLRDPHKWGNTKFQSNGVDMGVLREMDAVYGDMLKRSLTDKKTRVEDFTKLGISLATLEKYRVAFVPPQSKGEDVQVLFPYMDAYWVDSKKAAVVGYEQYALPGLLTYMQRMKVPRITMAGQRSSTAPIMPPPSVSRDGVSRAGLFGYSLLAGNQRGDTVVVASDVLSAMAVHQSTGLPAVACRGSLGGITSDVLPLLEGFQRVVLWPDRTTDHREVHKQAAKLMWDRVHVVDSQPHQNALAAMHRNAGVNGLIETARPLPSNHVVHVTALSDDIYRDTQVSGNQRGLPCTVLPTLHRVLKGFRSGELTVVTGPTGAGKTSILSALSTDYCMNSGVRTLWGSFEIPNYRLAKKMLTMQHGSSLDNVDRATFEQAMARFDGLPLWFMEYFGASSIGDVLQTMEHAAYQQNVGHFLLDNLQFMLATTEGNRFDRFDRQDMLISQLRRFASTHNVHVTLVIHPKKGLR